MFRYVKVFFVSWFRFDFWMRWMFVWRNGERKITFFSHSFLNTAHLTVLWKMLNAFVWRNAAPFFKPKIMADHDDFRSLFDDYDFFDVSKSRFHFWISSQKKVRLKTKTWVPKFRFDFWSSSLNKKKDFYSWWATRFIKFYLRYLFKEMFTYGKDFIVSKFRFDFWISWQRQT